MARDNAPNVLGECTVFLRKPGIHSPEVPQPATVKCLGHYLPVHYLQNLVSKGLPYAFDFG